jgi:hypothetical protein
MFDRNDLKAFSPPAEAPMPTIKPGPLILEPEWRAGRFLLSGGSDFPLVAMPRAFIGLLTGH